MSPERALTPSQRTKPVLKWAGGNRRGEFNVPFGNYKNPAFCQPAALKAAAQALAGAQILLGDYKEVLREHAREGDFVFLDPPYLPLAGLSKAATHQILVASGDPPSRN